MASPSAIREVRAIFGSTFNTSHSNAATSTWGLTTAGVRKLRPTKYDATGLASEAFPDESLRTRMMGRGAGIQGMSKGDLKLSTYLEGAKLTIANTPIQEMLRIALGGLTYPSVATNIAVTDGTSTTTNIHATSIGSQCVTGQAVLVGRKGDARGNGEVRAISNVGTDWISVTPACGAAPAQDDPLVLSTTAFMVENAAARYMDVLAIGHAAADQRQGCGAVCTFALTGTDLQNPPQIDFTIKTADHRIVPTNELATINHSNVPESAGVAYGKSIGLVHIGDWGSTTRTARKGIIDSLEPGVTFEEIPDPSGVNKIGGWQRMPGVTTVGATILFDEDMPGLSDDYAANTAKCIIAQYGHEHGKCVAVEVQKCFIDALPVEAKLGNLSAVKITAHAEEPTYVNDIMSSIVKLHMF